MEDPHPTQKAAISHIHAVAQSSLETARSNIDHILRMSNLPPKTRPALVSHVRRHARVAIHFHPDRPVISSPVISNKPGPSNNPVSCNHPVHSSHPGADTDPDAGKYISVTESLLISGVYKSQFETSISNGGLSAHAGGARDTWERDLFGCAYHPPCSSSSPSDQDDNDADWRTRRPKYGAWDLFGVADDGPAPRFGSCYLVLKPAVNERCTFTFGGSQDALKWVGTAENLEGILAAVLEEGFVRWEVLGMKGRVKDIVDLMLGNNSGGGSGTRNPGDEKKVITRNLDHIVEAQIHGTINLDRDVEFLVADPSFRGYPVGRTLEDLAAKFGFPIRWHAGYKLRVGDVPSDFRGPTMPSLAQRVAVDGWVHARAVGEGVWSLVRDPAGWEGRGRYGEVLQEFKLLWHVLVRFGLPT